MTTATTDTTNVRVSAHADCDHPKTKTARAACRRARRSLWTDVTRDIMVKGNTARVHTVDDMLEGVLLGWGSKLLVIRVEGERVSLKTADVLRVEGLKSELETEEIDSDEE